MAKEKKLNKSSDTSQRCTCSGFAKAQATIKMN